MTECIHAKFSPKAPVSNWKHFPWFIFRFTNLFLQAGPDGYGSCVRAGKYKSGGDLSWLGSFLLPCPQDYAAEHWHVLHPLAHSPGLPWELWKVVQWTCQPTWLGRYQNKSGGDVYECKWSESTFLWLSCSTTDSRCCPFKNRKIQSPSVCSWYIF